MDTNKRKREIPFVSLSRHLWFSQQDFWRRISLWPLSLRGSAQIGVEFVDIANYAQRREGDREAEKSKNPASCFQKCLLVAAERSECHAGFICGDNEFSHPVAKTLTPTLG